MNLETPTIRAVTMRLVLSLVVCYVVAYLDRVNVGFAALTMNKDLGSSSAAYGLGAGILFLSCFVFEVPSHLFLERFGARVDRADHVHRGHHLRRHGVRGGRDELLRHALPARHRRGGLLFLAGCGAVATASVLSLHHDRRMEGRAPRGVLAAE